MLPDEPPLRVPIIAGCRGGLASICRSFLHLGVVGKAYLSEGAPALGVLGSAAS
jgi:hypothetical protein